MPKTKNSEAESTDSSELNLYQKIMLVCNEVDYIQKELQKVNNQYRPIAYNAVVAACRPSMLKHGVLILPGEECQSTLTKVETKNSLGYRTDIIASFFCVNADDPAEKFHFKIPSASYDSLDKDAAKALTFAMKAALLKMFLIETGDEEESKYDYAPPPPPEAKKSAEFISKEQAEELAELCSKCALPAEVVAGAYGAKVLAQIPLKDFAAAKARIEDRIKKVEAKKSADAK